MSAPALIQTARPRSRPARQPSPAATRHRLLRRIGARFQVVTETVRVGGLAFPFTRVADPDRVLDDVAAEEDRLEKVSGRRTEGEYLRLPYWAELWDSAMGVAQFLAGRKSSLSSRTVLDLGCGMGLTGTVAAALGARVLFADLETPPLLFARLNSLPWAGHVRTRQLDWRTDRLAERFELVIGSDVLYERKQWEHIEPFWRAHLAAGGAVLLGEPGRPTGKSFPDWITSRGWSLRRETLPVATQPDPIQLFLLFPAESDFENRGAQVVG